MTDQRLYIDNVLVDIDDSTKITLDIKSNLFRDISNMASNTTYTVKLPGTVKNKTIIQHSDIIHNDSEYPYILHTARYYRNGVEIIKDGKAILLSSSDSIEMTIIWGIFPTMSDMISNGKNLDDLSSNDRLLWNGNNIINTYQEALNSNYFYAYINVWKSNLSDEYWSKSSSASAQSSSMSISGTSTFGGSAANNASYIHPSVAVRYVLELIKTQTGIDFNWSGESLAYINSLIIPLVNKKANYLTFLEKLEANIPAISGQTLGDVNVNIQSASNIFVETSGSQSKLTVIADMNIYISAKATASYDMTNYSHRGSLGWKFKPCYLAIKITKADADATENIYPVGISQTAGITANYSDHPNNIVEDTLEGHGVIKVEKNDIISFAVYYVVDSGFGNVSNIKETSPQDMNPKTTFLGGNIEISSTGVDDSVPFGGYYPIASNLPQIKITDFIKFLAAITGTFPMQIVSDNKITFVPYTQIWNNISIAENWTMKVCDGNDNKPESIEYTLSDYAQINYYKWKDDDTVKNNYDGVLKVANNSLDTEKTVMTFPFAASDGNSVPMYTKSDEEGTEPDYSACKDRIMRLKDDGKGNASGVFDISMQDIIDSKYINIINTLQKAKLVKVKVRLSDIQILNFNETVPVYLGQYGCYFAVTEIKSNDNGIAEVTMLKLTI